MSVSSRFEELLTTSLGVERLNHLEMLANPSVIDDYPTFTALRGYIRALDHLRDTILPEINRLLNEGT